jgi:hypothetical protein
MNVFASVPCVDNLYSGAFTFETLRTVHSTIYLPKKYEFETDTYDNDPITAEEESDLLISYLEIRNGNVTKLPKGSTAKDLLMSLKG